MKKKIILLLAAAIVLGASGAAYFGNHRAANGDMLTLYGNVDIRQVQLAFNGSERIAQMLAKEGDPVTVGRVHVGLDFEDET